MGTGGNSGNFGDFLRELQSVKNFSEGTTVIASQICASYPNLRSHRAILLGSSMVYEGKCSITA